MPISARLVVNPGRAQAEARRRAAAARRARRSVHAGERRASERGERDRLSLAPARHARRPDSTHDARRADRVRGRPGSRDRRRRSRRSSTTCARAATPRCSSTRGASTASTRHRWPRWRSPRRRCTPRTRRCRPRNATRSARRGARPPRIHERQKGRDWSFTEADGTELGQRVTPLDRVGVYVPGGKAAYPSSVLMNVIPAHVAGVREIVMVVPTPDGVRNPLVLAAAHLAGVTRAFTIGGAQAIAALAYGTQTDSRGRQDLRPRQRLRRGGQAPRVRRRRHRHGRRRFGNPRHRRRDRQSGLDRARPLRAGRARRNGAGDPADARRRAASSASPRARSG